MSSKHTIVLAGNPNCGKTELFNAITGSNQRVGNWPGVTVDKKSGQFFAHDQSISVVDLPGIYDLTAKKDDQSIDTHIACQYLLNNQADLIVNVVDASQLERHLFLTAQLAEYQVPMIVAVNMLDVAERKGLQIDLKQLSKQLGCKVVGLVAKRRTGIRPLKKAICELTNNPSTPNLLTTWPKSILQQTEQVSQTLSHLAPHQARWLALNACLGDPFAQSKLNPDTQQKITSWQQQEISDTNTDWEITRSQAHYQTAEHIVSRVVSRKQKPKKYLSSEFIDRIVLNRFLGIPIFLAIMYLMFVFAINIGGALQDFFDISSNTIFVSGTAHLLQSMHSPSWLIAILADGLGKGINTTITFIPVIGAMFLFLALLEDSGYMARAAFVIDRLMQKMGLPGQSFVPMIVGFGCNVPAVMGARTLSQPRDRILTILMTPFISCGARLAIFAVFASAFFPHGGQNVIFLLYLCGISAAILTGFLARKALLPGKPAPLVMALPEYHRPALRSIKKLVWQRLKGFLWRAGRLIVPICILIGSLNAITLPQTKAGEQPPSMLAAVGQLLTPLLAPMGIQNDNWPATVGLATGVLAKEVVVGTLNTLYSHQSLTENTTPLWQGLKAATLSIPQNLSALGSAFANPFVAAEAPHEMSKQSMTTMVEKFQSPLVAFSYLLFVLLYFPCVSTLAAMRREIPTAWSTFSMIWTTGLAYAVAVLAYQIGTINKHPLTTITWITSFAICIIIMMQLLKWLNNRGHFTLSPTIAASMENNNCGSCRGCDCTEKLNTNVIPINSLQPKVSDQT